GCRSAPLCRDRHHFYSMDHLSVSQRVLPYDNRPVGSLYGRSGKQTVCGAQTDVNIHWCPSITAPDRRFPWVATMGNVRTPDRTSYCGTWNCTWTSRSVQTIVGIC